MDTEINDENYEHFFSTEINDEYWEHLLKWAEAYFDSIFLDHDPDSLRYALYDNYEEPFNDRLEDV